MMFGTTTMTTPFLVAVIAIVIISCNSNTSNCKVAAASFVDDGALDVDDGTNATTPPSSSPSPTVSSSPSASSYPTEDNKRKPVAEMYYPIDRYVAWDDIVDSTYKSNAEGLGWTKKTWNTPGSNDEIETLSHSSLLPSQRQIADDMLLREVTWDCYINHYEDYDWYELVDEDVAKYFEGLGWTEQSWNCEDHCNDYLPDTEDMDWEELSMEEQQFATEICYFAELWDEYELGKDW